MKGPIRVNHIGGDLDGFDNDGNQYVGDLLGWDFRDGDNLPTGNAAHGTAVAGIIGASANNGYGVSGVTGGCGPQRGCSLMLLKLDGTNPWYAFASSALFCLDYAAKNGADVINLSLGWAGDYHNWKIGVQTVTNSYNAVIAAAGNSSGSPIDFPAKYSETIAVSGVFSNGADGLNSIGNELDLVGIQGIHSTTDGSQYSYFSATSSTAPQVAAAVGLFRSIDPNLSPGQIKNILQTSAQKLSGMNGANFNQTVGFGLLDIAAALDLIP